MELDSFLLNAWIECKTFQTVTTLTWTFRMKTPRLPINLKLHFPFYSSLLSFSIYQHHCRSAKKNFLHSVCSNTGFIF